MCLGQVQINERRELCSREMRVREREEREKLFTCNGLEPFICYLAVTDI
jgi:hypothetical protein